MLHLTGFCFATLYTPGHACTMDDLCRASGVLGIYGVDSGMILGKKGPHLTQLDRQ